MSEDEDAELTVVPIPSSETEEQRQRIRESNDRDQQLERDGKEAPHNRGYDDAADGVSPPEADAQATSNGRRSS